MTDHARANRLSDLRPYIVESRVYCTHLCNVHVNVQMSGDLTSYCSSMIYYT